MTRLLVHAALFCLSLPQAVFGAPQATTAKIRPQFTVPASARLGPDVLPNVDDPKAVDAQTVCPGYKASNVKKSRVGVTATLRLAGQPCNAYGTDIETLELTVQYQTEHRLSVNIAPAFIGPGNSSQYILSEDLIPKPGLSGSAGPQFADLLFSWTNDPTFSFTIKRKSTGDVVFTTKGTKLVYENQFIEFVTTLPKNYHISGLGERIHGLQLDRNLVATTYAADVGDPIDSNIYGSHPFYMDTRYFEVNEQTGELTPVTSGETSADKTYRGDSHGVFLRNAHGQEVVLGPQSLTWRLLGGSIDLYFFQGETPEQVTRQYQNGVIGLPAMQQYFTLGFHQCRWGYENWGQLQEVVDNFRRFDIPLENIWTDIDYMNQYRDFEMDANTFPVPRGQTFLSKLHANKQHYIPIVDSAIYIPNPKNASDAYDTYTRGHEADAFLKNPDGSEYIGAVWPGYTVFPDWHAPGAAGWWSNEMSTWHNDIPFDGIWIDMSEVSSFCVGSCGTGNLTLNPVHPPFKLPGEPLNKVYDYPEGFGKTNATEAKSASSAASKQAEATATSAPSTSTKYLRTTPTPGVRNINYPPYVIKNVQGALGVNAVSPNGTHSDGVKEYDVHNLWGHQILGATREALLNIFPSKRPFIIGRSTFSGTGKWAGHWGGDNYSKWLYMYFSIPQALSFSLFGIPMFGVDTCGFNGNTDEELCNRWMQLSAFFPFYRNHNTLSTISQEPYQWVSVIDASKTAMNIRYSLLPYMYTQFFNASDNGTTVMRAMAWEFPEEPYLAGADRQFLLGPAVLVTPVLTQGARSVNGVFPGKQPWYDWYTQEAVAASRGQNVTIPAPLGHIPVYLRGGYIVPTQQPGYTTFESRRNPWGLLVALDKNGLATGELYNDDGESLNPSQKLRVSYTANKGSLKAKVQGAFSIPGSPTPLADVTIMGVKSFGGRVTFNGQPLPTGQVKYNQGKKVLKVTGLKAQTPTGAWSKNFDLSWD